MYCTPWCPACNRAREYLREQGIEYAAVDISRDWASGNETTPTFDIMGTIVVDFDRAKLDRALGVT